MPAPACVWLERFHYFPTFAYTLFLVLAYPEARHRQLYVCQCGFSLEKVVSNYTRAETS